MMPENRGVFFVEEEFPALSSPSPSSSSSSSSSSSTSSSSSEQRTITFGNTNTNTATSTAGCCYYYNAFPHFAANSSCSSASATAAGAAAAATALPQQPIISTKRRAGRKKFRETRHPVYRGVRERNGGKWVCELREPGPNKNNVRIWLGTYVTPEMAARAHDVAAIALRGETAQLNFPDSLWRLPRPVSPAHHHIRAAAVQAAQMFRSQEAGAGERMRPSPRRQRKQTQAEPVVGVNDLEQDISSVAASGEAPLQEQQPQQGQQLEGVKHATVDPPPCQSLQEDLMTVENLHASNNCMFPHEHSSTAPMFVDEEELFNMPALLRSMAEGMLLTPPELEQLYRNHHSQRQQDGDQQGQLPLQSTDDPLPGCCFWQDDDDDADCCQYVDLSLWTH